MARTTVIVPGEMPGDAALAVGIDGGIDERGDYVTLDVSALVAAGRITQANGKIRLPRIEAGAIGAGLVAESRRPNLTVVKP